MLYLCDVIKFDNEFRVLSGERTFVGQFAHTAVFLGKWNYSFTGDDGHIIALYSGGAPQLYGSTKEFLVSQALPARYHPGDRNFDILCCGAEFSARALRDLVTASQEALEGELPAGWVAFLAELED